MDEHNGLNPSALETGPEFDSLLYRLQQTRKGGIMGGVTEGGIFDPNDFSKEEVLEMLLNSISDMREYVDDYDFNNSADDVVMLAENLAGR